MTAAVHVNRLKSAIAAAARPPSPYDPPPGSREHRDKDRGKGRRGLKGKWWAICATPSTVVLHIYPVIFISCLLMSLCNLTLSTPLLGKSPQRSSSARGGRWEPPATDHGEYYSTSHVPNCIVL